MTFLAKVRVWLPMVFSLAALALSLYGLHRPAVSGHTYGAVYTPNQLIGSQTWPATATNPTLSQAAQTSDVATNNIVIQSQAPFASASTNKTAGNVVLDANTPVAGGNNSYIQVNGNGAAQWYAGQWPTNSLFSVLFPQGTTLFDGNHYALIAQGGTNGNTFINGSGSGVVGMRINNSQIIEGSASAFTLFQPTTANSSLTVAGVLTVSGGIKPRVRTNTTGSEGISSTDYYVLVNKAAAVTETLPPPSAGLHFCIKDASGNASTNNITVSHNASENIDGAATKVLNANFEGMCVTSDGANWYVTEQVATVIL